MKTGSHEAALRGYWRPAVKTCIRGCDSHTILVIRWWIIRDGQLFMINSDKDNKQQTVKVWPWKRQWEKIPPATSSAIHLIHTLHRLHGAVEPGQLDTLNDKTNNRKDRKYLVKNIKFWLRLIELERSQVPRPCRQHVSRTAWHVTFCCDTFIDNQTWHQTPWMNHSSLSNKQLRHERGAW